MKKIFLTLAIVASLFAFGGEGAAAAFTQAQVEKLMSYVDQHPAASPENTAALPVTAAQFKTNFNAEIKPVLDQAQFNSADDRAVMEKLFLIQDFQVSEGSGGKFYLNVFGDSVAIFGVTGNDSNRFKLAACSYTKPENQGDETLSSLVLLAFTKVIAPDENPQELLKALAAEESGTLTRNDVKFTAARDGDLVLLSAVKAQ